MTEYKDKYNCGDCRHKAHTQFCEVCIHRTSPSGKVSKPTLWEPIAPPTRAERGDLQRATDLAAAIVRYLNDEQPIPYEWVAEYNEIRHKRRK